MTQPPWHKVKLSEEHWQIARYILGGGYNTLFGLAVFALLYFWLGDVVHYLLISIVSNILAITNAFVLHRYFVFRSRGNLLAEYFRTYLVYGGSVLLGMALLAGLVELVALHPVLAQGLVVLVTVVVSYVGHSRFTFAPPRD